MIEDTIRQKDVQDKYLEKYSVNLKAFRKYDGIYIGGNCEDKFVYPSYGQMKKAYLKFDRLHYASISKSEFSKLNTKFKEYNLDKCIYYGG